MYTLTHQNGKVNYGLKKFIVDSVEDIEKIPTISLLPGSTAFIPKSSKLYIYQDNNTWIEQKSNSKFYHALNLYLNAQCILFEKHNSFVQ